ncbi:potassium transporter TrkG [Candidatus Venteria ishoeyi]|uniref:Trk system potassium uptake protein n=1 Tax=Candidatus Venteria ishoeyi TaxID=1899563 RepID=A0A1H6FJ02_9GAMM|nr:potassium transporter TrkG [Candidatus Venteria ishoeyi]SEH09025.1 Trk system potassium uptake protein TrkH [Candidatus Venteria ishoeyi]
MQLTLALRLTGILLGLFSFTLIPPILFALHEYDIKSLRAFHITFALMSLSGFLLWKLNTRPLSSLQARDGFMVTVLFWFVLSLVSALPFWLAIKGIPNIADITVSKAVFEAVSGFTTTGATTLTKLDQLPRAILYYRQQLQFLGGMGIIVLAIAILPMLGLGGYQLQRAEAPGPMRDEKLTPRLASTAKLMMGVYFGLTALCAIAFYFSHEKMDWFEAIAHSFTTVSTSGFSTHDKSLGYFDSALVETVAIIFMILGSLNFTIYFNIWYKRRFNYLWQDLQARVFIYILLTLIIVTTVILATFPTIKNGTDITANPPTLSFLTAFRYASFHVVSLMSTTGFSTQDYSQWPLFLPVLVFGSGFIGGCIGSTAGGFKITRIILLYKQGMREILRLIHPNAVLPVRLGKRAVPERVGPAVLGFTFLYMASFLLLSLLMMAADTRLTPVDAFAAVAACINTIGPALGKVTATFSEVSAAGLWVGSFSMLLGRLEILTLLVVLHIAFWRK